MFVKTLTKAQLSKTVECYNGKPHWDKTHSYVYLAAASFEGTLLFRYLKYKEYTQRPASPVTLLRMRNLYAYLN